MRTKFLFFTLSFCDKYDRVKEYLKQQESYCRQISSVFDTKDSDAAKISLQVSTFQQTVSGLACVETMREKLEEIQKDLNKAEQDKQNQLVPDLLKKKKIQTEHLSAMQYAIKCCFNDYETIITEVYPNVIKKTIQGNAETLELIKEIKKYREEKLAELNSSFNDQSFLDSLGANKNKCVEIFKEKQVVFFDFQKKATKIEEMLNLINEKLKAEDLNIKAKLDKKIEKAVYYTNSQKNLVEIGELKNQLIVERKQIYEIIDNLNAFIDSIKK